MGSYLNPKAYRYRQIADSPLYIDKSSLIGTLNRVIGDGGKLICATMPTRFGKTYLANMIAAYYTKGDDTRDVFSKLDASRGPAFEKHLNRHNVIKLDISEFCGYGVKEVEPKIVRRVGRELADAYPKVDFSRCEGFADQIFAVHNATGERFVIVIDEWDYLLRNYPDEPEVFDRYMGFLRSLFKTRGGLSAIELCYMTGIMPIKRYGSMSALNEFDEFTMVSSDTLAPCFGFSEVEVKKVMEQSGTKLTMDDLREWYDGYHIEGVGKVYCPNSVVQACRYNECDGYTANTMAPSAITKGLKNNFISLEKEAAILLSGGSVYANPGAFSGDLSRIDSADQGIGYLIHAGFLRYSDSDGRACIPNREMLLFFRTAAKEARFEGCVTGLAYESWDLFRATVAGDEGRVAEIFDKYRPRFDSLFGHLERREVARAMAGVAYSDALDYYLPPAWQERFGERGTDVAFLPLKGSERPALVIEATADGSTYSAIERIKAKEYYKPLENYCGEVLLVRISFDKDTLKHTCRIERIIKDQ